MAFRDRSKGPNLLPVLVVCQSRKGPTCDGSADERRFRHKDCVWEANFPACRENTCAEKPQRTMDSAAFHRSGKVNSRRGFALPSAGSRTAKVVVSKSGRRFSAAGQRIDSMPPTEIERDLGTTEKLPSRFASRRPSRGRLRQMSVSYGSALLATVIAVGLRFALDPLLGRSGFAVLLTGMLVAAWVGGLGPSLLCQTLILFANALWFQPERGVHSPLTLQGVVSLFAFYSVGSIVAVLSDARHRAQRRANERQSEATSQREKLLTTLACMADGVVVTDADGRVTQINPAAETMTGWRLSESRGKAVRDLFVVCDALSQEPIENPVQRTLREQEPLKETVRMLLSTRHDRSLPVSYTVAPIRGGENSSEGAVMVIRDETDRLRTERALRIADKRKDEFLATLAHELRNPLAPISMGLELLKISTDDPAGTEEVRSMMERQTQHMVRLIDDLLDVSRITRGKLELRRSQVPLSEIVRNAIDATRPAMEEAGHELVVRLPEREVLLYADPGRITQVLSNLLSNAAKYTPAGGNIELVAEIEGDEAAVTVSDNGCGIASDQLGAIFDMFMQVRDAKERGHQGLGIGLTLVERLVEMHGGSVVAASGGLGKGSRFCVRLPLVQQANSSSGAAAEASPVAGNSAHRRVLVVDDNPDALKALSLLVSLRGHDVRQARDGAEAITIADEFRPEVIFMDLGMPKLSGFDAARRIREAYWGQNVLLVATTGWGQEDDRRRTKEAGFDHHLVKPILPLQIHELLSEPPLSHDVATLPVRMVKIASRSQAEESRA